jgi:outer membrane protein assembly factor BamB
LTVDPIYALRASDGKLLWQFQQGASSYTPDVLIPGNGFVYEVVNNHLYALRAYDGKQIWSFPQAGDTKGQYSFPLPYSAYMVLSNGVLYFYTSKFVYNQYSYASFEQLYALQASTGKQVWTFQQNWSLLQEIHHSTLLWHQLTMDSGVVYIQALGQKQIPTTHIFALRASDGALLGSLQQNITEANISMVDGIIYADLIINDATSFSYFLSASQASSSGGKELWEFLG